MANASHESSSPVPMTYASPVPRQRRYAVLIAGVICLLLGGAWLRSYAVFDGIDFNVRSLEITLSSRMARTVFEVNWYEGETNQPLIAVTSAKRANLWMYSLPPSFYLRIGGDRYQGLVMVKPIIKLALPHWFSMLMIVAFTSLRTYLHRGAQNGRTNFKRQ